MILATDLCAKSIYQSIYHIFSICENIFFIHAYIVRWVYSIRVIIKLDELTINRHLMISIDIDIDEKILSLS